MFHALFLYNCQRGGLHSLAAIDGKYVSFAVDKLRAIGQINVAVVMTVAIAHEEGRPCGGKIVVGDRKSTRLNSSHANISYAVFCLKKKKLKFILSHLHIV